LKITSIGSVLSAFLSSVCCIGPLIFTALGVGAGASGFLASSAEVAKALVPYRPFFMSLTLLFLGAGFYSVYRKKACDVADSGCSSPALRRTKILLWVITGMALILMAMPYLLAIGG
jgi:mercuric ion transport protein